MYYIVKLTVVVSADTHGDAVRKVQTAIELDKNKSAAYVESIDKVEAHKK